MSTIAILVSDIHLSLKVPRCRASEPDWMEVQRRQLRELKDLQQEYNCPILCAGDIFHQWNAPAELIQFALQELPDGMYCVPGNHDLAYHDLKQLDRTAYGVLKTVGKIIDLPPGETYSIHEDLEVVGFPWGVPISENPDYSNRRLVAVVHEYVWIDGAAHPRVTNKNHHSKYAETFAAYDVVHLGDNHTYWQYANAFNPGSFYRRTVTDGHPRIGILAGNKLKSVQLGSAVADIIDETADPVSKTDPDFTEYLESLNSSADTQFDFCKQIEQYTCDNMVDVETAKILHEAMEET